MTGRRPGAGGLRSHAASALNGREGWSLAPERRLSDGAWKRRHRGRSGADGRAKGLGVVQQPSVRVTGVTAEHLRSRSQQTGVLGSTEQMEKTKQEARWWQP